MRIQFTKRERRTEKERLRARIAQSLPPFGPPDAEYCIWMDEVDPFKTYRAVYEWRKEWGETRTTHQPLTPDEKAWKDKWWDEFNSLGTELAR